GRGHGGAALRVLQEPRQRAEHHRLHGALGAAADAALHHHDLRRRRLRGTGPPARRRGHPLREVSESTVDNERDRELRGRHDWEGLRQRAVELMRRAYAPYSGYPVGVAGVTTDGRVVAGCNVENAGYGVTLCAECGMVSELVATGGGRLAAVVCVNRDGHRIMPCGRCRQLLWEHGGPDCLLDTPEGILPMTEVLPQAFGPEDLESVRSS